jgi:hypothetical protein
MLASSSFSTRFANSLLTPGGKACQGGLAVGLA